jgi:hypothetical protein
MAVTPAQVTGPETASTSEVIGGSGDTSGLVAGKSMAILPSFVRQQVNRPLWRVRNWTAPPSGAADHCHKGVRRRERGMAAERNLSGRGKPSKPELSIRQRLNESCLGQVKFGSNGLAKLVGQLTVHQHHGSRVASKWSGSESVNHHPLVFHHLNFDSALSFHHHNLWSG